ncbi:phosphoenolpyruvate--protein phosphotransferase, partial [Pseudonocardia sp. NPDC049154]|uniref:phosphoenolpyruvate--protein phosphotransferase n=1 Tax=Pseudonocardia sp. NPDC049154 TaxID=3155501 RepID=UPI0033F8D690
AGPQVPTRGTDATPRESGDLAPRVGSSGNESPAVLVAADLTPAEAAVLDPEAVVGVVLAGGSATGHAAILLRARGIPAVMGAGPAVLDLAPGTPLALDGTAGRLVVDPSAEVRAVFGARLAQRAEQEAAARARADEPARTRDGVQILVGVNVGADAASAAGTGADLAGLVRTEFLFLDRAAPPDVDEQEAAYRAVAEALGGRRIVLRTLDVGGDKPLPYVPMPAEANPFLGVRGLRLALRRPDLLADQLRAIVRTAHATPVGVMFPMVTVPAELHAARAALDEAIAAEGRGRPPGLEVGIMVEVPAVALTAAAFAPDVDFLSIGTNDLTQYTLAAERGSAEVAALADPLSPAVLRLVDATCRGAGPTMVAVCGELAADPVAAPLLVGLGVRELSVAPPAVALVKQAVREVDAGGAAALAARALDAPDPAAVRALLATAD